MRWNGLLHEYLVNRILTMIRGLYTTLLFEIHDVFTIFEDRQTQKMYRVRTSNCPRYILEPGGSHMHLTGQNKFSLEPHSPHKDFDILHAHIGQS